MKLAANIFKAYDIRGIYGKELTLDAIGLIAKSISNLYPNDNDTIVIGRDGRNSSSEISKALIDSFLKNTLNIKLSEIDLKFSQQRQYLLSNHWLKFIQN